MTGGPIPPVASDTPVPASHAAVSSLLASGRPVVALLASEYAATFHPLTTDELGQRLAARGFIGMETTVLGEELVAGQYERSDSRHDQTLPTLRSTCFAAVSHVRDHHSELVGALAPIVPPYIAQARLIRSLYPADVAIVYASPCEVRKEEVREPGLAGSVDAVIGLNELRAMFSQPAPQNGSLPLRRVQPPKQLSLTDGFPRKTLAESEGADGVVTVRGAAEIDRLLDAIARGEAAPRMVDMLMCDGCLDGPCVNSDMTLAEKREAVIAERRRQLLPPVDSRDLLAALPSVDLVRSFRTVPALGSVMEPEPIRAVASTCLERLEGEIYRARRYGGEVSLVLLGDPEGKGGLMLDGLRESDVVCPISRELVAVIMPGIGKTAAWGVAERLLSLQGGAERGDGVRRGFSAGVCDSAGGRVEAGVMLHSAHEALDEARQAGGGRVELAAG